MGLIKQLKELGAEKLAYHSNLKEYESYLIEPLNDLSYFSPLETELMKLPIAAELRGILVKTREELAD